MAEATLANYVPILIMLALALLIVGVSINLYRLLGPRRRKGVTHLTTYESGEVPVGSARGPMDVQFYMYVLTFLILDVEVLFLVPWALHFAALPPFAHGAMAIFVGLIIVGWLYEWKKGALKWQS